MAVAAPDHRLPFARLLHRGLDLPSYFEAADRTLARLVPFEASCWLSLDPATLLPTSHFSREYGFDQLLLLAANEFLEDDENRFADLARTDPSVDTLHRATDGHPERSRRHTAILTPHGFGDGDELRAVFRDGDETWGAVAIHRRTGTFTGREIGLVRDVGAVIANGIRRAILLGALSAEREPEPPGLVLLDADDAIDTVSPAASVWLAELFDTTAATSEIPLVLASVAHQARQAGAGESAELASVRAPRRSGGWLRLDASLLADGRRVAVMISAAREPEVADLIARTYGLTAREREVTRLTMLGLSTREMAARLHLSPYTVQDHLKSIFDKVDVRTRRELVAQLFLQQCAPRLTAGASPSADGWFGDAEARQPTGTLRGANPRQGRSGPQPVGRGKATAR
jgi:DNA-binding CsgD family transcriptional regulator